MSGQRKQFQSGNEVLRHYIHGYQPSGRGRHDDAIEPRVPLSKEMKLLIEQLRNELNSIPKCTSSQSL